MKEKIKERRKSSITMYIQIVMVYFAVHKVLKHIITISKGTRCV